jgi:apolipoprotein N-acyltransferase
MRWLSLLAGGTVAILVFPAPSLSYVAWFGLVPAMMTFAGARTAKEAVARGWWFGAGYIIAMLYWLAPEIGPGLLLLGGVAGCTYSPFAVSVYKLLRRPLSWRRCALALVVVPSCWIVPEWIRSYQGLGGPWGLYGASQWQHPAVLALAAIGAVWLVSVALVIANAGLFIAISALASGAARRWGLAALGAAAFIAAAGSGPLAFALTPPFPAVRTATVALVQPGVLRNPTAQSDASEVLTKKLSRHGSFGGSKPDLIVWGESSIDEDLTLPSSRPLLRQIEALSAETGAEILVNEDATPPGKGHEKWAALISPAGIKGIYVKTRLVPFGEYIPFRQELGWLTAISKAAATNMTPGTGAHLIHAVSRSGRPLPIGVLICFESAFPDMSRVDADLGAQLIVYQSSTVTFQGTWGPDQHASLAALRAAETGRPVVQAALTGVSVAYDARGRELARMGQSSRGVLIVRLRLPAGSDRTFYDQHGDYVMWACVSIAGLAALIMIARRLGFLGGTTGAAGSDAAQYEAETGQPVVR